MAAGTMDWRRDGKRKSLKGSCERCVGWQLKDLTPWNPSFVNFQTFTWEASVKQKCLNTPLISPLENGKKKKEAISLPNWLDWH